MKTFSKKPSRVGGSTRIKPPLWGLFILSESFLLIHLICPVGHGEGELVGVFLLLAGVDVLDAA